ncbi:MAG: hypothetical protein H8E16_05280 [Flavobacteriales bacterium]|nr:hypothetical protein [Flavobacteriales bacterium]
MKNTFIQSFINDKAETFLEIGSTVTEEFDSIPTDFMVTMDKDRTRWLTINKKKLSNILVKWNVTIDDVKNSLQSQFGKERLIVRIK